MKGEQLPLAVGLPAPASFENFHAGPNTQVVATLRSLLFPGAGLALLLHGPASCGKTHLLRALIREAGEAGISTGYVNLAKQAGDGPGVLEGLAARQLVCLDGIDEAPLSPDWLLALVRLLDALKTRGHNLAISARKPASALHLPLPDLLTRLSACASFGLKPLSDEDRAQLLSLRAHARGLHLPDDVAHYLLKRLARDVGSLLDAVEALDKASLSQQRRLTIPFVQAVLLSPSPALRERG